MSETSATVYFGGSVPGSEFYVTGGTLRPDAPSYVERSADKALCEGLLEGEFCYVLTSRQMGKSSLMVRTVKRLRDEGLAVAVLDLTAIGQNLTIDQWYDGLMSRLGQQLNLEDEMLAFWESHPELGPLQRWVTCLEKVVLQRVPGKIVIFVDEIDIVRSLPFSTDEFFAAIRECYNRRSRDPVFNRLAFGLLGVATPTDLIRDTRMTPFNIGRRIELNDFKPHEAAPLARGLGGDEPAARKLLDRVLHWTGGHPYLTQRLCRALAEALWTPRLETVTGLLAPPFLPTIQTVDKIAEKLFLSRQARDRDDNLIFVRERILRSETDVAGLLYLYRKILQGQLVPDDETNQLVSILRLSGITKGVEGFLQVRNRVYERVFDGGWIQTNMPEAEVRRQRRAGRRGMVIGLAIGVVLLLAYVFVIPKIELYRQARLASRTAQALEAAYTGIRSYRDTFETMIELGLGGTTVPIYSSGSLIFEKPGQVNLSIKSGLNLPDVEIRALRHSGACIVGVHPLEQYQIFSLPEPGSFDLPGPVALHLGPARVLPVYRLLLDPANARHFLDDIKNVRYERDEKRGPEGGVHVIKWDHSAKAFLATLGRSNTLPERAYIPVTAWINNSNLIVRLHLDLSTWADEIVGSPGDLPVTGLTLTESHTSIQTSDLPSSPERLRFEPPPGAHLVQRLDLPRPNFRALASPRQQFLSLIPPRLPWAPPNLIDLTDYYNAALVQTWHPGTASNALDALPPGLLQLAGNLYDVRGVVQVSGGDLSRQGGSYPKRISGIRIGQRCRELHFLHATGWPERDGVRIGSYIVHYNDGQEQTIPIVYGEDVRDWNGSSDTSWRVSRSTIVWREINNAGFRVRLFATAWINPSPEKEITSLDFVSAMTRSAPYLIAVTAEQ